MADDQHMAIMFSLNSGPNGEVQALSMDETMHRLTQPRKQLSNFKLYLEGHLALEPPYVEPSPSPDSSVRSMSPSDCIPMDSDHLITPPEDDKAISKQRTTAKASLPSSDTGCMDSMLILNHGSKSRETGVELGSSTQLPTSISVAATSMERYLTPSLDATTQPEGPLTAAAQLKSDVNYSRGSEEIQLSQRRTNTRAEKKSETSWAKPFRVTKSTSRTATLRSSPRFGRLSDLEKDHSTSRRRQSRRSHGSLVNYSNNTVIAHDKDIKAVLPDMSKRPEVSSSVIRHGNGAGKRGKAAVDVSTKDRKSKLTGRRVSEGRVSKSLDRMKQRNSRRTEYEKQSNRPIDKKRRAATPVHPAPLGGACCRRSLHTMQTRLKSRASGNT